MGATIQKQCCGNRDSEDVKDKQALMEAEGAAEFLKGEGAAGAESTASPDLKRFDQAGKAEDVNALVALVDSKEPFTGEDKVHPWAAQPRTVGALTVFQLASMASKEAEADIPPKCREGVREIGAIPKLVGLLSSKEEDLKQAAIVAISFLAVDHAKNSVALFEAGALPALIQCMKRTKPPSEFRGAAADTARNIYTLDVQYREAFVAAGGIPPLVDLLTLPPGETTTDPKLLANQFEAVFHIEDMVLDDNKIELPRFKKLVVDEGAIPKIQALLQIPSEHEEDVREVLKMLEES